LIIIQFNLSRSRNLNALTRAIILSRKGCETENFFAPSLALGNLQ
jgi:hypothetical protein